MKRLFTAVIAAFLIGGCSNVAFVDQVTIVNDTGYSADVEVSGRTRDRWLGLATVGAESTHTVEQVIDQGEVWIFRFDYVGKHQEEVEIPRRELEREGWTIRVPQTFEQRLRELGVPPPP